MNFTPTSCAFDFFALFCYIFLRHVYERVSVAAQTSSREEPLVNVWLITLRHSRFQWQKSTRIYTPNN